MGYHTQTFQVKVFSGVGKEETFQVEVHVTHGRDTSSQFPLRFGMKGEDEHQR